MIIGNLGGVVRTASGEYVFKPTVVVRVCRDATTSDDEIRSNVTVEYGGVQKRAKVPTALPTPCSCSWVSLHVDEPWDPEVAVKPRDVSLDVAPGSYSHIVHVDGFTNISERDLLELARSVFDSSSPVVNAVSGVTGFAALLTRSVRVYGMVLRPGAYLFEDPHRLYIPGFAVVLGKVEPVRIFVNFGPLRLPAQALPPMTIDVTDLSSPLVMHQSTNLAHMPNPNLIIGSAKNIWVPRYSPPSGGGPTA